jgi:hypothetical protein
MPIMDRLCVALAVPLVLSAPAAEAQVGHGAPVAPVETEPARSDPPDFRIQPGDFRAAPRPVRNGLIGRIPLRPDLQISIGRIAVPNFTAPRMEGADIRRSDRGIAAVGFNFRF